MINTTLYCFIKYLCKNMTLNFICRVYYTYIFVLVLHNVGNGIFRRVHTVWSVSAFSAGAYTTNLCVMVNRVKGGGRASPTLISLG